MLKTSITFGTPARPAGGFGFYRDAAQRKKPKKPTANRLK